MKLGFILVLLLSSLASSLANADFARQEIFIPPRNSLVQDIQKLIASGAPYTTLTTADGEQYLVKVLSLRGDAELGYYFGFEHRHLNVTVKGVGQSTEELEVELRVVKTETAPSVNGAGDAISSEKSKYTPGNGISQSAASAVAAAGLTAIGSIYDAKLKKIYESIGRNEAEISAKLENIESMKVKVAKDAISLAVEVKKSADQLKPFDTGKLNPSRMSVVSNPSRDNLKTYQWASKDLNFVGRANTIRDTLTKASVRTDLQKDTFELGKEALIQSDHWSAVGAVETSESYLEVAQAAADVLVGWDPFTGFYRSLVEFTTGRNAFKPSIKLTGPERLLAGLGLVTAGWGAKLPTVYKLAKPLAAVVGKQTQDSFRFIGRLIRGRDLIRPEYGNAFVRNLPDLTNPSIRAAFDGHVFKGVYEPGTILFQAQRSNQSWVGRWFTAIEPLDADHAEVLLNIRKHNNTADEIKIFYIKERVSGYAGKVAGGEGHQFYVPEDIPLDKVLIEMK